METEVIVRPYEIRLIFSQIELFFICFFSSNFSGDPFYKLCLNG